MKHLKLFLLFLFISSSFSCNGQEKTIMSSAKKLNYTPTIFPSDSSDLWISDGDINKDTVLIIGEGGPKNSLGFEENGRVYWEYLQDYNNYYFAVIHQSNSYNKSIFGAEDFTYEDAEIEVDNSSEILHRAVEYYKNRGKYVVVLAHSYGAFVITHYLSTRASLADKYIITGGRLDANETQTAFQAKGINTGFEDDGKTLVLPEEDEPKQKFRLQKYFTIRGNKEKLKYASGRHRYTELLKNVDLSNLIFYYGKMDQNVGALSESEILFLQSKGAIVKGVETDHYNIWKRLIDGFTSGEVEF